MTPEAASPPELLARLAKLQAGQPEAELVRRWVATTLAQEEDVLDSRHVAHALRCDEEYVWWCCEVDVRLGRLRPCAPSRTAALAAGATVALAAWRLSTIEALGRLALEHAFAESVAGLPGATGG